MRFARNASSSDHKPTSLVFIHELVVDALSIQSVQVKIQLFCQGRFDLHQILNFKLVIYYSDAVVWTELEDRSWFNFIIS